MTSILALAALRLAALGPASSPAPSLPTPSLAPSPAPPASPVVFGANLPQVGRYSPESDWGAAGGLAGWALKGRVARVSSLSWAAWPFGFDGKSDLGQAYRQMEVCRGCAGVLVVLSPSEWPLDKTWVPPKANWPSALAATKTMIATYDAAAKKFGLPMPRYQLWNETSPGKPGGARTGPPGEFYPALHPYLSYLAKGLGVKPGDAMSRRLVSPAYSDLTDSPEAARKSLATGASDDGYWEDRVGAIAIHVRLSGPGLTPEQYEARTTEIIDRCVASVRALPHWKGKSLPVDVTEAYVTPGDVGRPELAGGALDPWRLAALRGAAKAKIRSFLIYGLPDVATEGGGAWGVYGGWAPSLAGSKIEAFAKTARAGR